MNRFSETFFSRTCNEHVSNVCDHCKNEVMEDLRQVYEYRRGDDRFYACNECFDECMEAIEHAAEEQERRERIVAAGRKQVLTGAAWVLQQTAPHFAAIGNGLFVRTGNRRKR